MAEFNETLQQDIDRFRERVLTDEIGVLDPEGEIHHEFVSGNHGRKLDFDKIEIGTDFYIDWVSIYARAVLAKYSEELPQALVGIAKGANRLSKDVSRLLGRNVLGLTTTKLDPKTVRLDRNARRAVRSQGIQFVVTIEDVGTTGSTTLTAMTDLLSMGVERVESINFWQRNPSLPKLEEREMPYSAVILDPLPMFSPEKCASDSEGYCHQGIPLIPHE